MPFSAAAIVGLGWLLVQPAVYAAEGKLIQIREVDGQLRFFSTLAAGNHKFDELAVRGRAASAQILVESGDGGERSVRQFRLESWHDVAADDGETMLRAGFAVQLEPTSVSDRFRLRLEVHRVQNDTVDVQETMLRRGFGMYYMSVSQPLVGTPAVVGRAKSLLEMMLEFPTAYRAFEETAHHCSLPGILLVPQSRFSPSVVDAVMGDAIPAPIESPSADWTRLVAELDSDDFVRRAEASESLLALGVEVVPYLRGLRPEQLSLEQRARISYVLRSLTADLPPTPQPLAVEALRELQLTQPPDWLARLVISADARVSRWALDRLRRLGIRGELPPNADSAQRRALYDDLMRQINQPPASEK